MIDIVYIDDLFPEGSCYKFNNPKFGYTLNLGDFVRYHFEHRLVRTPQYINDTYVFLAITNPDNITTLPIFKDNPNVLCVSNVIARVSDNEKLNIVISYPMETFITDSIIAFVNELLESYPKARFFFSQGNANTRNKLISNTFNRITYLPNPLFEAHYGDYIRNSYIPTIDKQPLEKKFLVPIRQAKPFRLLFYIWMKDNGLLENSHYSWTTENLYNSIYNEVLTSTPLYKELSDTEIEFLKVPVFLDDSDRTQILKTQWNMNEKVASSFMQIVLETTFTEGIEKDSPTIFLTEKTYKPIFYKQPFILISEPFSLRYLRGLGYKTFGSFIDESYDVIIDPHLRMKHITNEILKINSMSISQLEDIRVQIQDIVEHNYNVFMSRPSEKILVKHIEETLLYGKQRSIKLIGEQEILHGSVDAHALYAQ